MADVLLDPWVEAVDEFPLTGTEEERLEAALRLAILAPSSHNTQPWLFELREGRLDLYADRSRALPVADPDDRELIISCGAALRTLRVALRNFEFDPRVSILPDPAIPDLLARVEINGGYAASQEDHALYAAIRRRHTNRSAYQARAVEPGVLARLVEAAESEGAWLRVIEGTARERLADLIAAADRRQMADRAFRRELALWVHPNRSRSRDGMPGYVHGMGNLASEFGPLVIRTFDLGEGVAARNQELALGSPVLAVLGTERDGEREWIAAGEALAHLLLRAEADGLAASFLNQPVELPDLRPRVGALCGDTGCPQIILRLGYPTEPARPTPRRPVGEVMV